METWIYAAPQVPLMVKDYVAAGQFDGGFRKIASGNISINDSEQHIEITLEKGLPQLVATDKNGKLLFEGPIATKAQIKALPEAIRKKLESVQSLLLSTKFSPPASPLKVEIEAKP